MTLPAEIRLPPETAYTCGRCNRCCKGEWLIAITASEAASLRNLYPDIEPTSGVETLKGEKVFLMARRPDGACVYLDEDGCRIQKNHGSEAKPAVCRRFPFFLRVYGDVAYAHLSRMCPTVYRGEGASGEALVEDLRRSCPDAVAQPRPSALPFAGSFSISWSEYLAFEDRLVEMLSDERWTLDDAVAAGYWLLQRIAGNERAGSAGGVGETEEAVDLVMTAIARRNPMIGLHRYVLATIVTMIESRRGKIPRAAAWWEDFRVYFRVLLRRGTMKAKFIDRPVPLREVSAVAWPRKRQPDLTPVRRYLVSHIRHKFLLVAPDIELAYHLFMGAYAAIKFYARASAAAAGREQMSDADLEKGVEAAEYNLLLHRPMSGAPTEKRLVRGFFRKFLFHPSYPASMTVL